MTWSWFFLDWVISGGLFLLNTNSFKQNSGPFKIQPLPLSPISFLTIPGLQLLQISQKFYISVFVCIFPSFQGLTTWWTLWVWSILGFSWVRVMRGQFPWGCTWVKPWGTGMFLLILLLPVCKRLGTSRSHILRGISKATPLSKTLRLALFCLEGRWWRKI